MISRVKESLIAHPVVWAISWTVLIVLLLSVPGQDIPSVGISGIDKPVHAALFFVFTVLWSRVIPLSQPWNIVVTLIVAVVFGVASELYQGILPFGRIPDKFDVLADWIGAVIAAIILFWRRR